MVLKHSHGFTVHNKTKTHPRLDFHSSVWFSLSVTPLCVLIHPHCEWTGHRWERHRWVWMSSHTHVHTHDVKSGRCYGPSAIRGPWVGRVYVCVCVWSSPIPFSSLTNPPTHSHPHTHTLSCSASLLPLFHSLLPSFFFKSLSSVLTLKDALALFVFLLLFFSPSLSPVYVCDARIDQ